MNLREAFIRWFGYGGTVLALTGVGLSYSEINPDLGKILVTGGVGLFLIGWFGAVIVGIGKSKIDNMMRIFALGFALCLLSTFPEVQNRIFPNVFSGHLFLIGFGICGLGFLFGWDEIKKINEKEE